MLIPVGRSHLAGFIVTLNRYLVAHDPIVDYLLLLLLGHHEVRMHCLADLITDLAPPEDIISLWIRVKGGPTHNFNSC